MSVVQIHNLEKSYGTHKVLHGLSFEVHPGEIFGLLGQNGAGKTTTLDIVEGLREADAGEVTVLGMDIRTEKKKIQARIGVQLQSTSLIADLSVADQVKLFARLYQRRFTDTQVRALLERFALTEKAKVMPNSLSGGEKQRLVLALALLNDPEILFLDEPTAGLDVQSRRMLWNLINEWHTQDRTVVLTTHYIEEAEKLADKIGIIDGGQLVAFGTPAALIEKLGANSVISIDSALPNELVNRLTSANKVVQVEGCTLIHTGNVSRTHVELVNFADQMGIMLGNTRIQYPSLEDVFVSITGKTLPTPS
jgi:ABC-2 type transport system ATP-binding protein